MALERIEAWLAVRNAQRFESDMDKAARSVRRLGDEQKHIRDQNVTLAQGFGGVRIGLGQYVALALGALPIIMGLAGATGALASSLGMAALGSAALATGIAGTMLPALTGMGIVIGRQVSNFGDVQTALQAYQLAVASYGRDATQAHTALKRLSGVVEEQGGIKMLRAVRMWQRLGEQFDAMTAPGRESVGGIMTQGLSAVQRILPAFTQMTNKSLGAVEANIGHLFAALSGREAQEGLRDLGAAFSEVSGPLTRAFTDVLMFILRVARASIPHVIDLALGIEKFGAGLDRASRDPAKLSDTISGLIEHTAAWWGLFKEVGLLVVAVMRGGAGEGKTFVETLTEGVRQLRMMAESTSGQNNIASFMRDSVENSIAFGQALWSILGPLFYLARDAMPLWTDILEANAVGLTNTLKLVLWLSDLMEPLGGLMGVVIVAFWGWKAALLAWNIIAVLTRSIIFAAWVATQLWTFWTYRAALAAIFHTGVLSVLSGAWARLNAMMFANPIGIIILALAALAGGIYYAYQNSEWFRNAVNDVWNALKEAGRWALQAGSDIGNFFGPALEAVYNTAVDLLDALNGISEWDVPTLVNIGGGKGGLLGFGGIDKFKGILGGKAEGGPVSRTGAYLVGERGPEIVRLQAGSAVIPNNARAGLPSAVRGRGTVRSIDPAFASAGGEARTIIVPVQLNGREIARVVADDTDDRMARRP